MLNKLIKKIISWFGYKLVEKNYIKNRRTLSKNFFDLDKILNHIFSNNLAKNVIQIGANDGKRFDPLNKYLIKYETKTIFVEPIKEHFEKLKRNYSNKNNCIFENSAISDFNGHTEIFKVNENNLNLYDDHIAGISSFQRNHLIKHGVKSKHISSDKVNTLTTKNLIEKYKINNFDLLFIDVEGHEQQVLEGSVKILENNQPNLLVEIEKRHRNLNPDYTISFLREIGYQCFVFDEAKLIEVKTHRGYPLKNNFIFKKI